MLTDWQIYHVLNIQDTLRITTEIYPTVFVAIIIIIIIIIFWSKIYLFR